MRQYTIKDKLMRLKAKFPQIITKDLDMQVVKEIYSKLQSKSFSLISYTRDYMKESILALILKQSEITKEFPSNISIMNAYELIEIYLGHVEEITSVFQISPNTLIIYLGYSEFENKRQSDILEQVFENQRVQNKRFHVVYKGRTLTERYPKLVELFKQHGEVISYTKESKDVNYI